jgi:hypothetical protein
MKSAVVIAMAASWYLVGLSFTVALVTYPSFSLVGKTNWKRFHEQHSRRISWAVGPAWLIQALSLLLWLITLSHNSLIEWIVASVGAFVAVVLTLIWAVPAHNRLRNNFDVVTWKKLQRAHLLRTGAWTLTAIASTIAMWRSF